MEATEDGRPVVLIVDDDLDLLERLESRLSNEGFEVQTTTQGQSVLELAKEIHANLILLDVMLRDISGFSVCRQIRHDPILFLTPIIVVSAMADPREIDHGRRQGCDRYLTKPVEVPLLISEIKEALESSKRLLENVHDTGPKCRWALLREINYRLIRNEGFALVDLDILNFKKRFSCESEQGRFARRVFDAARQCKTYMDLHETSFFSPRPGTLTTVMPPYHHRRYAQSLIERVEDLVDGISAEEEEEERLRPVISLIDTEKGGFEDHYDMYIGMLQMREKARTSRESIVSDERNQKKRRHQVIKSGNKPPNAPPNLL